MRRADSPRDWLAERETLHVAQFHVRRERMFMDD